MSDPSARHHRLPRPLPDTDRCPCYYANYLGFSNAPQRLLAPATLLPQLEADASSAGRRAHVIYHAPHL
jgi:hypothetical protein